ncbi:unnamed protein product, partial [Prorocentrum cordatum]
APARVIEVSVSLCACVGLFVRQAILALPAGCKLVQARVDGLAPPWLSLRAKVRVSLGFMRVAPASWSWELSWGRVVSAGDAGERGLGGRAAWWGPGDAVRHGRVSE